MNRPRSGRGFSLVELLVAVGVIAVLVAIALPVLAGARRAARATVCAANLQQLGVATSVYAGDERDQIWALTWRRGNEHSDYRRLHRPGSTRVALGDQVIDAIRRKDYEAMPALSRWPTLGWAPTGVFSHVTLIDYLGGRFPLPATHCPEDRERLLTAGDPQAYRRGEVTGRVPEDNDLLYAYASTYTPVPASYDPNQSLGVRSRETRLGSPASRRMFNTSFWGYEWAEDRILTNARGAKAGGLRLDHVAQPSAKVHVYDHADRHSQSEARHYALPGARQPLLFFDASVRTLSIDDANVGWKPNDPNDPDGARFPLSRNDPTLYHARFRWTRSGMQGVDYAGADG